MSRMSGMVRWVTLICLLCLGVAFACCTARQEQKASIPTELQDNLEEPWTERGEFHLNIGEGASPLDIVQGGFKRWLGQFSQPNAPLNMRLATYHIDAVEAVSDPFFAGDYEFVFRVEYSVLPLAARSNRWLAGDGREGQEGWVVGKIHFVGITVQGEFAHLYMLGPCPKC